MTEQLVNQRKHLRNEKVVLTTLNANQCNAEKYAVRGIPYLVIIDQHGNIVDKEGRGTVETASGTQLPEKWKTV